MKIKFNIEIQAETINEKCYSFKCPMCYKSKHSKKPMTHSYPSDNNLNDRIENVVGYCKNRNVFFSVFINENTKRV